MDDLLGRDDQSASIIAALSDATRPARSFLIEGEPGIGKTALVRFAMAEATARGYRVLETRPVEAEAGLALVGLGDLLGPVLSEMLPALPDPQRVALEIALLLRTGEGRAHDQRALGLAVLHGLQALSRTGPVVVAVDDAHWLDATTSAVLRFALRRLVSEPIVMLVARRPARPGSALAGGIGASGLPAVEHIELGPLSMGAVHRLVGDRLGIALSRPELRSIHGLSRGNPLYALELARGVRDGTVRPERDEISATGLETLVGGRIRRLPARSREVLATAAAASRPTVGLLERALGTPDVHDLLGPAARAGVVTLSGDEIEFDHPLLASAALAMLDGPARRACHARLAAVVHEPVEHARHLALAATEPDPEVAAQVEQAAMLTRARGAASGAADLMSLAIQLTASGAPAMPRRRLLEAEYRLESGDAQGAATMLERLAADTPPGPSRAVVLARLAHFHHLAADTGGRVDLLRQALLEAAPDDPIRGDIHEALAWALVLARYDLPQAMEHARAAAAIMGRVGDPNALAVALALQALVATLLGLPDTGLMERALAMETATPSLAIRLRPTHANGYRLTCIDELDAADRTYAMLLARAEEQGDESAPSHLLGRRSVVRMLLGDLTGAERLASQAVELSAQTGQLPTQAAGLGRLALILARRGDLDRATRTAGRSLELASQRATADGAEGTSAAWTLRPHARGGESALWALGHVALCQERWDDAANILTSLTEPIIDCGVREPGDLRWLSEEVEALLLAGRVNEARDRTRLLLSMADAVGRPSATSASLVAKGLVHAAEGHLDRALTDLETAACHAEEAPLPFERARVQLSLGRVQRRLAHKRDARRTLERATGTFEAIGAAHWAETCRTELGRIGGRPPGGDALTETERRVVALVARGLSNKEVASALFVTPKAVEASLSRIFAKTGVRSRAELAALAAAEVTQTKE